MKKKLLAMLLCACMVFSFVALSQNAAYAEGETYNAGDVAVINAMITNNGLSATPDSPASWDFAVWNMKDTSDCRLKILNLNSKALKGKIDLTDCAGLSEVHLNYNEITELDLSGCPNLFILQCNNNKISSLDLSGKNNLGTIECDSNQLSSLDVSDCSELVGLSCSYNKISSLDLSGNTFITSLSIANNLLTSIDVRDLVELGTLYCSGNQITSLDLSKNAKLVTLYCDDNKLSALDVTPCKDLQSVLCNNNQISSLDLSQNPSIIRLNCSNNNLSSLDLSNNNKINYLQISGNPFTSLVVPAGAPTVGEPKNGKINISQYECEAGVYTIGLEAVPDSGYVFDKWNLPEGAEFKTGAATDTTITVTANKGGEITAAFKAKLPDAPNTGDNTMLVALAAAALLSAAAIAILAIKARKSHKA